MSNAKCIGNSMIDGVLDQDSLGSLFRTMLRIRVTEESIAALLEQGEIRCPTHLYTGQEAIAAGVCAALNLHDCVFGGHRSHGHYLAKGGNLRALMAELYGKSTGCARGRGGSMHLIAPEVGLLGTVPLVAATIPVGIGAALAFKLRGESRVSVPFFGDGATEEGHFHESMNLAALYHLPVVFVCENNLYSSHMHMRERRAEENIYKSGEAHGVPAECLDGNDVVAVYRSAVAAVDHARAGRGPTLLECRTYRWRGHVGPALDMDVGVKRKDELKDWITMDPVARAKAQLIAQGLSARAIEEIEQDVTAEVQEAIQFARESPFPPERDLEKYVFANSDGGA